MTTANIKAPQDYEVKPTTTTNLFTEDELTLNASPIQT